MTHGESRPSSRPRPGLGVGAGVLWLAATCVLSAHGVEPVASFCFVFAWAGLIYTVDRLIAGVEGSSLVARLGARRFALLAGWSAVNWFAYELANVRLANWHYVLVTDVDLARFVGTVAAFGTVFPGVFWIDHWLRARGVLARSVRGWRGGPARATNGAAVEAADVGAGAGQVDGPSLSPALLASLQVAGGLALVLCLVDPAHFYPLIWGVTALLIAPLNHRLGIDGWLAQWQRRAWRPTLRMLLAGLLAGGCWEFFNFWARARWIYTVPFFDELKLFEMPVLGFLGFPPFALECACVYRLLVWLRLAPAFGSFAQVGPPRGPLVRRLAAIAAAVVVVSGWLAVDRVIVTSRTPRVADVAALEPAQRQALAAAGVMHLTQLVGWGSRARWARVDAALDSLTATDGVDGAESAVPTGDSPGDGEHPARGVQDGASAAGSGKRLRRTVALYLHQGIGTTYGNRLLAAGYRGLDDLRGHGVDEVWERLRQANAPGPVPSRAQVKVWLQRLPAP